MKKLFFIVLCTIIVTAPQSINVSAANASNIETIDYQYKDSIVPMRSDVIEYKFREYYGRLQYRRWNATRCYWVDPNWIYA